MTTITLLGAGGKMGLRITDNLRKTDYDVRYVEVSDRGKAALASRGITAVPLEEALKGSRAIILALPDNRIGQVMRQIGSLLPAGVMLIAPRIPAPLSGAFPARAHLV